MDREQFIKDQATAALLEQIDHSEKNLKALRSLLTEHDPHDHVSEIARLVLDNKAGTEMIGYLAVRVIY